MTKVGASDLCVSCWCCTDASPSLMPLANDSFPTNREKDSGLVHWWVRAICDTSCKWCQVWPQGKMVKGSPPSGQSCGKYTHHSCGGEVAWAMAAHWLVSTANGWLVRNMRRTRLGISDQGSGNELRGWACENEYTWCGSLGDPSEAYRMPDLLALYPAQHRLRLMYTKCVVERSKTGPSSHVPWVCHVPYHPGISPLTSGLGWRVML